MMKMKTTKIVRKAKIVRRAKRVRRKILMRLYWHRTVSANTSFKNIRTIWQEQTSWINAR
jgi:hypothetical protein